MRDRARADADLCEHVERRAAQLRASLEEQRRRHQVHHKRPVLRAASLLCLSLCPAVPLSFLTFRPSTDYVAA